MKNNVKILIFVLVVLIVFAFYYVREKRLQDNLEVNKGYITKVYQKSRSGFTYVNYTFNYNNKTVRGETGIPCNPFKCLKYLESILVGRSKTIVVEKGNPNNNKMLFQLKDYRKYKIAILPSEIQLVQSVDSVLNKN